VHACLRGLRAKKILNGLKAGKLGSPENNFLGLIGCANRPRKLFSGKPSSPTFKPLLILGWGLTRSLGRSGPQKTSLSQKFIFLENEVFNHCDRG
jgi:hypothetical protein